MCPKLLLSHLCVHTCVSTMLQLNMKSFIICGLFFLEVPVSKIMSLITSIAYNLYGLCYFPLVPEN